MGTNARARRNSLSCSREKERLCRYAAWRVERAGESRSGEGEGGRFEFGEGARVKLDSSAK